MISRYHIGTYQLSVVFISRQTGSSKKKVHIHWYFWYILISRNHIHWYFPKLYVNIINNPYTLVFFVYLDIKKPHTLVLFYILILRNHIHWYFPNDTLI